MPLFVNIISTSLNYFMKRSVKNNAYFFRLFGIEQAPLENLDFTYFTAGTAELQCGKRMS